MEGYVMFESLWNLLAGVFGSLWQLLSTVLCFASDILVWLHVEAPRLEGLLVGVLLAWLLSRRDSHPLLRVASAPLKLLIDILDLAWDQFTEICDDVLQTGKDWLQSGYGWLTGKFNAAYGGLISKLKSLKSKLKKDE